MPKPDVLALIATLSNGTADPVVSGTLYDQAMFELARENWFCNARLYTLTKGQQSVSLGSDVVNINALIYDEIELEEGTLRQMEALDPQWRDPVGYPRSYVVEDVMKKDIELHPGAFLASDPDLGHFGEPLGGDYPTYNLALFFSYAALVPQQPQYYLELVIALRVLALEHARESDHTDMDFSAAAQGLSDMFKGLLA